MAVEDFGAATKGMKVEIIFADHQNKPDVGSNIARQWFDVDKVDVIVDVPNSARGARREPDHARQEARCSSSPGAATSDLTGKACSPNTVHWTYDTWALANGTGNAIVKTGGDTWFFLTADYAFGHALERDTEAVVLKNGGKVLGKVRHPLNTAGLLLVPPPGAGLEGQDHRPRQRGRRHHQLDQAGRRVRHRQGRPELRRPARVPHRRARARARQGAGPDLHRVVLLGHERPDARLRQALRRAEPRHPSDDDPRRRLRGGAALPEGGRGAEERTTAPR